MSSAAAPVERQVARPNGWWGMAVFVATEATLFGTLIGSYFYLRFHAVEWPPAGVPIVLAFAVALVFVMVLTTHYVVASVIVGIAALMLATWHSQEPAEQ